MSFPTIVYRCPGPFSRPGGTWNSKGVNTEAELSVALADGWFRTMPEAIEGKAFGDDSPPTRSELEQKAAELGIKPDGRWSDKRLSEEIAKRLYGLVKT